MHQLPETPNDKKITTTAAEPPREETKDAMQSAKRQRLLRQMCEDGAAEHSARDHVESGASEHGGRIQGDDHSAIAATDLLPMIATRTGPC